MRELNATACAALYEGVEWSGPWILVTLVVLAIVNVMVVLGNVLVILAVHHTSKLRNVTNMFIVSLAVADLMVGLAVLPFSATWEVFKELHFSKRHRRKESKIPPSSTGDARFHASGISNSPRLEPRLDRAE